MSLIDHINKEDVIENGDGSHSIVPPDYLVRIARDKKPEREYAILCQHADYLPFLREGTPIPVSFIEKVEGPWTAKDDLEAEKEALEI